MRISDWSSDVCSSDLPSDRGEPVAADHVVPCASGARLCTTSPVRRRFVMTQPSDTTFSTVHAMFVIDAMAIPHLVQHAAKVTARCEKSLAGEVACAKIGRAHV